MTLSVCASISLSSCSLLIGGSSDLLNLGRLFGRQRRQALAVAHVHEDDAAHVPFVLDPAGGGDGAPDVFMSRAYGGLQTFADSGYMLALDELMPGFGEKTRYNIRLAARKGVTTRWAGTEALETFFRIYLETCERDGIGHRPPDYFARMMEAYGPERCRICLAEYEGEPLAAAIALHYGRKVFYIYGASSNEKRNLMPAYAMQAEMIRWACSLGVDFYDFGGVYSLQKENGLYRFKEGFCHAVGVTELAGEFDRVLSPFWYWAFLRGKPLLQKLRARRKK